MNRIMLVLCRLVGSSCIRLLILLSGLGLVYLPHLEAQNESNATSIFEMSDDEADLFCAKSAMTVQRIMLLQVEHSTPDAIEEGVLDIFMGVGVRIKAIAKKMGLIEHMDQELNNELISTLVLQLSEEKQREYHLAFCEMMTSTADRMHDLHIRYGIDVQDSVEQAQSGFSDAYRDAYRRIIEEYEQYKSSL